MDRTTVPHLLRPTGRVRCRIGLALAASLTAVLVPLAARPAAAGGSDASITITTRVAIDGHGGQQPGGSYDPVLSSSGRYLAFEGGPDLNVYVQDLLSGQTTAVSLTPKGTHSAGFGYPVGVSDDGKRVAYLSAATDLGPAPHTAMDLYVRDLTAHTTTRANVLPNQALSAVTNYDADLSADGDVVMWAGGTGGVWLRRLSTGKTQRVDVSSNEAAGTTAGFYPDLSADGGHVVFVSAAKNLVSGDTNNASDVFERNITAGTTVRIGGNGGVQLGAGANDPSVSGDGSVVAFDSSSTNAVVNDTNGFTDVFVSDVATSATLRLSIGSGSVQGNQRSDDPAISADGTWVAFRSDATNLVSGDTNAKTDFFDRRLLNGTMQMSDRNTALTPSNGMAKGDPQISGDGSVVAFASEGSNLVPADTNQHEDVFVRLPEDIGPHPSVNDFVKTQVARFQAPPSSTAAHLADVVSGRVTPTHLIVALAHAAPWATDREPVTRLYTAFFQREPDPSGLTHWVNKHHDGSSLDKIASSFAASSEFKTKYGKVSNTAFVTLVYGNVLQRKPDAAGLAHWVAKLDGGMSRGQVMVQFSESSEGKRVLAPPVDATLMGLAMLQALPKPSDHHDAMQAGELGTPDDEALFFLDVNTYGATL